MAKDRVTKKIDKRRIIIQTVDKRTRQFGRELALDTANTLAGRLRQMILGQELNHAALAPSTVAAKARRGGDPRILVDTRQYVNSIRARRKEGENAYEVGVADEKHELSDANLRSIAAWLEYGTRNADGTRRMPARPHWRPIWQEFVAMKDKLIRDSEKKLRKKLRGSK